MNTSRGLVLLLLIVLPTFYNFQQAWERTAKDTWLDRALATEDPEVIYNVPSLPPALKGIKLIRRDQKTSESPNRSTRLSSHSRLLTNLGSSDELSEGVSGEVSGTEGRTAAAGLATWPWFSFLTPERDASRDRTPPAGSGVNRPGEGASLNAVGSGGNDIPGPDNDIIGMKGGVGQMGADVRGKSVGGRRLGGSSRQAIASIMRTMETALSGESEASHEEGPANRSLHGRDLSGIRRPQQCPAFRPDHFRRLAGLPEPQTLPTPDAPFLFLHNRKCGGSTLRHLVQESAAARQLTSYIPCFEPVACETYDLANMTTAVGGDVSVVAGHFSWDAVEELSGAAEMSCYTTLRDPIEMFASYFYQRHPIAALEGRNLSSLSPQALRRALDTIPRVELDDNYYLRWWAELGGPANSAVKMMTAADITGHPFGTNAAGYAERRRGRPADLTEAKRNMDRCVVGLLSDWETTLQVLNHWFPWIQTSSWAENKGENRPSDEILPEGIREVILDYMDLDVKLYEHGLERFAKEKELVTQLNAIENDRCTIL